MLAADKDPFTAFIQQLATALHAHNAKLIVDIVPHDFAGVNGYSAAYDVAAIGKAADLVDLMAYDEHGDGGTPGPVAGLDWDTLNPAGDAARPRPVACPARRAAVRPRVGEHRRRLGLFQRALQRACTSLAPGSTTTSSTQTPFIVSPNGSLTSYFDDADSLARKIALVKTDGLAGIAAWRLGFEDPKFWSLFTG